MAIIPKINVGLSKKRERHNWNFDSSTTANIGQVQPTMCREMVPGESIQVNTRSFVRLSPVAVPTFGRMSLRNYHCFVPYNECYDRFDNFITAQSCKHVNGTNYVPEMPYFNTFAQVIFSFSDVTLYYGQTRYPRPERSIKSLYTRIPASTSSWPLLGSAWSALVTGIGYQDAYKFNDTSFYNPGVGLSPNLQGVVVQDDVYVKGDSDDSTINAIPGVGEAAVITNILDNSDPNNIVRAVEPVSLDAFDYAFEFTFGDEDGSDLYGLACFRLKPIAKRFRSLVLGLGYSFTPFEAPTTKFNPLKLIAFYKAYFSLFAPTREQNFEMTACYALMQYMHDTNSYNLQDKIFFINFIGELMNVAYYLPMDYFSMATSVVQQPNSDIQVSLISSLGSSNDTFAVRTSSNSSNAQFGGVSSQKSNLTGSNSTQYFNPLFFKVADQFLRYANKNTVIGRSVRDYLKTHFGYVDSDVRKVNGVEFVGSNRVEVQIGEVMSNAQVPQGSVLGEYAGRGSGYNDGDKLEYQTTDKFGCYLVLTVIVPESGYNQGYLRENRQVDRYDFPTEDFDALGYQSLECGELMDAYNSNFTYGINGEMYDNLNTFGFVPRYSHHKVSRNIVSGDLSLPSLANNYGSYTFDRQFPVQSDINIPFSSDYNNYVPTVVFDGFRKLDMTDKFGNYNRIFNYVGVDMDHFIIHQVFNVNLMSPLKSLSDSFDTFAEGDDTVTDVSHS